MSHSLRDPMIPALEKTIRKVSMDLRRQKESDPVLVKALSDLVKAYAAVNPPEKPKADDWDYENDGEPGYYERMVEAAQSRYRQDNVEGSDRPRLIRRRKVCR